MTPTEILARLSSYRQAAQEIRRKSEPLNARLKRMVALVYAARAEADQFLREQAELIVIAQASILLSADSAVPATRGRIETAARRLRQDGLAVCPLCEQRLSDVGDWAFWESIRKAELERLRALEADA